MNKACHGGGRCRNGWALMGEGLWLLTPLWTGDLGSSYCCGWALMRGALASHQSSEDRASVVTARTAPVGAGR